MATLSLQNRLPYSARYAAPAGEVRDHLEVRKTTLLERLREALDTARELQHDAWDFALDLAGLRVAGVSDSEVRWAVVMGMADHRMEVTTAGAQRRCFIDVANLQLTEKSCFVLTRAGERLATEQQLVQAVRVYSPAAMPADAQACVAGGPLPVWDPNRRQLRVNALIVKEFKVPAANQVLVLSAFQELGWPTAIDDPLPPRLGLDRKRRLHDTINSLNRNQRRSLLKFRGKGNGKGVFWEFHPSYTILPPDCV